MPVSESYIQFVRDLLAPFEPLRIKRMFGGAGIYTADVFFAILADDTLYLKVDDHTRPGYERWGLRPFSYTTKRGRTSTMSYYPVPPDVLEGPEALKALVQEAVGVARRTGSQRTNLRKGENPVAE